MSLKAFASRYEADKLRPGHLYQLTAYLRNVAAANAGPDATAAGVLLYPEVHQPLPRLQYQHGPHRVTATSIDLAQDWRIIHQRLLEIVTDA